MLTSLNRMRPFLQRSPFRNFPGIILKLTHRLPNLSPNLLTRRGLNSTSSWSTSLCILSLSLVVVSISRNVRVVTRLSCARVEVARSWLLDVLLARWDGGVVCRASRETWVGCARVPLLSGRGGLRSCSHCVGIHGGVGIVDLAVCPASLVVGSALVVVVEIRLLIDTARVDGVTDPLT